MTNRSPRRLALVVSHPIQYFVPLYQRLAQRDDLAIKVFYTWHVGQKPVEDRGFKTNVAWDIPLTEGYECELVPNSANDPGTHRFFGLRNPALVDRIMDWQPDLVLINGWAWFSHLRALHTLHKLGVRTLFRGDSHLLDGPLSGPRGQIKRAVLRRVFSWPAGILVVGSANRTYFESLGVAPARLFPCPHSIDVKRFGEPAERLEREAAQWRRRLGIAAGQTVLLYAGKFERKKRPLELMQVVRQLQDPRVVLVLAGGGKLQNEINTMATTDPGRFRILPFQNQNHMPVVYRLGDLFVLPSAGGETWGLAVNEALACGRPVLVSDRVGCAADLVDQSCGRVFRWHDLPALKATIDDMINGGGMLAHMRVAATKRARVFDIAVTEAALLSTVDAVCAP